MKQKKEKEDAITDQKYAGEAKVFWRKILLQLFKRINEFFNPQLVYETVPKVDFLIILGGCNQGFGVEGNFSDSKLLPFKILRLPTS